jgi:drug/metabolite transporter, DME family
VLGTALLVASPSGVSATSSRFLGGVLLAFLAGLAYALYVLTAKATLRRSAPLPTTALTFASGAVLLTPALLWTSEPASQLARGWPWLLYLGAVATAGAYAIYTVGLRRVPASVAGVTTLLEPLTATILGVALFGERLGAAGAVGAVLMVVALGLLTVGAERPRAVGPVATPRG